MRPSDGFLCLGQRGLVAGGRARHGYGRSGRLREQGGNGFIGTELPLHMYVTGECFHLPKIEKISGFISTRIFHLLTLKVYHILMRSFQQ